MEKRGLIRKLKKKTKDKIENEPGMTRRILTRGVERVYFEMTEEGEEQLDSAVDFSTHILFSRSMKKLHDGIRSHTEAIIGTTKGEMHTSIIVPDTLSGVERARSMLPRMDLKQEIYLLMEGAEGSKDPLDTEKLDFDMNHFHASFDDIPLKSNYLDMSASFVNTTEVPNPEEFLTEMVRTIKKGGILILVDFRRIESSILGSILSTHLDHYDKSTYRGQDPQRIEKILKEHLSDIEISTYDELFLLTGKKKG